MPIHTTILRLISSYYIYDACESLYILHQIYNCVLAMYFDRYVILDEVNNHLTNPSDYLYFEERRRNYGKEVF